MNNLVENYDVAIVGAGHAGCEAALACARLGLDTIMFTVSVDSIALMPCNPNIGGSSKGHLVREIDALGGEMGKILTKPLSSQRCSMYPRDRLSTPCVPRRISRSTPGVCEGYWKIRNI